MAGKCHILPNFPSSSLRDPGKSTLNVIQRVKRSSSGRISAPFPIFQPFKVYRGHGKGNVANLERRRRPHCNCRAVIQRTLLPSFTVGLQKMQPELASLASEGLLKVLATINSQPFCAPSCDRRGRVVRTEDALLRAALSEPRLD